MTTSEESIKMRLVDIAADMLSECENDEFARRLLSLSAGEWTSVKSLCNGLNILTGSSYNEKFGKELDDVEDLSDGEMLVTWLEHPDPHADDYSIILFMLESLLWSTIANYNRSVVLGESLT